MMRYLKLSCSVAALSAAAIFGVHAASGAPGKANPALNPAAAHAAQLSQLQLLVPLRKSITALTPAELASLRKGYAQMIAWNSAPHGSANFKRSLTYWANIHAYFNDQQCAPASGVNQPGMSGISVQTATTADENTTWCTCEHGTSEFLTWHRMYLYYFEKVLQAAAGDATLRLPYWDYETDGHIPAAYRSPTYVLNGATLPNPLFVANRQAQLNAGTAALTAGVVSTSGDMSATSYGPFNSAIEQTPHGAVHCATGVNSCPTGYMGAVPAAGNDPIFYSHHANIDRLYECWLKVNPAARLPTGSILTANFSFIDGTGTLVTRQVADMKTTAQLHYGYTAGGGCPRIFIPHLPILLQTPKVIPLLGPTQLNPAGMAVPVKLPPASRDLVAPGGPPAAAKQATLVLEGVTFDQAPGVMFEVALQGANGQRVPVGIINFFNDSAPHKGGMRDMEAPGRKTFDATAALAALGGSADAKLVVVPTTGITGERDLPAPNPRANVRFSAARLELR